MAKIFFGIALVAGIAFLIYRFCGAGMFHGILGN
jgi:hypothetical protein